MVAFTAGFGLPYYEATDPACFGGDCGNVNYWCDLIADVEDQINVVDAIVGRTAAVIPMARLVTTVAQTFIGPGLTVDFESVVFDTDDMVDYGVAANAIVPRRNGVYIINSNAFIIPGTADTLPYMYLTVGLLQPAFTPGVVTATTPLLTTRSDGNACTIRATTLVNFTSTSPSVRAVTLQSGDDVSSLASASLDVYWVRDAI